MHTCWHVPGMDEVAEAGRGSRSFSGIKRARIFTWVLEFHDHFTMALAHRQFSRVGTYPRQTRAAAAGRPWPGPWQDMCSRTKLPSHQRKLQCLEGTEGQLPSGLPPAQVSMLPSWQAGMGENAETQPRFLPFCAPPRKAASLSRAQPTASLAYAWKTAMTVTPHTQLSGATGHTVDRNSWARTA